MMSRDQTLLWGIHTPCASTPVNISWSERLNKYVTFYCPENQTLSPSGQDHNFDCIGLCRNPELQANHGNCFSASPGLTVKATKLSDIKKKAQLSLQNGHCFQKKSSFLCSRVFALISSVL